MKVSIITATFNSAKTIKDCLQSINSQTYKNVEHIVIDGESVDETLKIINAISPKSIIISEPDSGIYDAMNKGISIATGEIIGILNSDDLYVDDTVISSIVNVFKNKPEIECVYADLFYVKKVEIGEITRVWKTGIYKKYSFAKGWHPAHPTLFLKRDLYKKYGMFNLNYGLAADFEFMLRIFEVKNVISEYLPKPIVYMRQGGATSKSVKNIVKQNIEILEAFKENGIKVSKLYSLNRIFSKLKQFRIFNLNG
jgi:glycosyltransferase involved in cell wall biosynthesis